jgi:hypothetical protein
VTREICLRAHYLRRHLLASPGIPLQHSVDHMPSTPASNQTCVQVLAHSNLHSEPDLAFCQRGSEQPLPIPPSEAVGALETASDLGLNEPGRLHMRLERSVTREAGEAVVFRHSVEINMLELCFPDGQIAGRGARIDFRLQLGSGKFLDLIDDPHKDRSVVSTCELSHV